VTTFLLLSEKKMKSRQVKKKLLEDLSLNDWENHLHKYLSISPSRLINPLISLLYHPEPLIKWRAVTLIGHSMKSCASKDKESARIIIRRFMWYLNEESGGVGWGIPESFGEVLSQVSWMAKEYASNFVYYIIPGISFLDMEALQTGVIWGIGRAAQGNKQYFEFAGEHLVPFLSLNNPYQRGIALWALKQLDFSPPIEIIQTLKNDLYEIELYDQCILRNLSIANLTKNF